MFAKLTSMQMLRRTRIGLRPAPMPRVAPAHANDNQVARGSAGATNRPVLTCRWVPSARGGLECRWEVARAAITDEPGGAARVQTPVVLRGRTLALVAR
jgi:hypothetical protein